ncbi:GtrA family protein [Streptococcus pluranimalium]|uniref:GtrA family protein n=1 Tax=Streptococcus pluranimalium TaxID=82348 RepID=UPI0024155116|nr:GtrA family protein [Streptococcus pluranimalium]MDY3041993.1 GtrA family protein [Streptococcus pluranimalium]WFM80416.1 GtrA family protein [Streptococcus pluranimalium]
MKAIKKLLNNEVISYLIFGALTTLVYLIVRTIMFSLSQQATLATIIANAIAILFAFFTNDSIVFKQKKAGWQKRLVSFVGARLFTLLIDLVLAVTFVEKFPNLIGQFVNHDLARVNLIESLMAQVIIIIINYVISKFLVFKNKKTS